MTGVAALALPCSAIAGAESLLGFRRPRFGVANRVDDLHIIVLAVCIAIVVIAFAMMFLSIVRCRRAAGPQALPFHRHLWVEIVWSIIPCIIVLGLAYPAVRKVIDMKNTPKADLWGTAPVCKASR